MRKKGSGKRKDAEPGVEMIVRVGVDVVVVVSDIEDVGPGQGAGYGLLLNLIRVSLRYVWLRVGSLFSQIVEAVAMW